MSTTAREAFEAADFICALIPPRKKLDAAGAINTLFLYLEHRQRIETNEPPVTPAKGA